MESKPCAPGSLAGWIRSVRWEHGLIALILAVFLTLGFVYSVSTPLLEGPDEMWHYPYVKHIADGLRRFRLTLPRQPETDVKSECHQPPLYYALSALVTWPINTDDLEALFVHNPYWGYQARAPGVDNKNIFVHTEQEKWPYRGAVLAIYLVRWLSVFMGGATVLGVYILGLVVFPERKYLAAGAAALAAFTPQFLYLSGTVNNDNLITPLCTFAVWLSARLVRGADSTANSGSAERWETVKLVTLGGLIGLALATKWTALALLPLVGLALLYQAWVRRSWRTLWWKGWLVFGVALLLPAGLFIRNLRLYGDPLGIGRKMEIFPPRSPTPTWRDLVAEIPRKELSYWASFGWENIYADPWVYPLLRAFVYIGLLGLAAFLIWKWRKGAKEQPGWPHLALLALWSALVLAAFVRWMIYTEAAVGRHLFPAIASNMLLLLWGWTWPLPPKTAKYLTAFLVGALFLLAAVTPYRYIRPVYAGPPRYAPEEFPPLPNRLDADLGSARLLGYAVSEQSVVPGDTLHLTLYWQAQKPFEENYSVFVHLVGEDGTIVAQRDTHPGLGHYPTTRWRVGEIIEDTYPIPIADTVRAPQRLRMMAGLYLLSTMQRLPVRNNVAHEQNAILITQVELRSR